MIDPKTTALEGAGLAAAQYLWGWLHADPQAMCDASQLTWLDTHEDALDRARARIETAPIADASQITVMRTAENLHTVHAQVTTADRKGTMTVTVVREIAPYTAHHTGRWGVNPSSVKWVQP